MIIPPLRVDLSAGLNELFALFFHAFGEGFVFGDLEFDGVFAYLFRDLHETEMSLLCAVLGEGLINLPPCGESDSAPAMSLGSWRKALISLCLRIHFGPAFCKLA